MQSHVHSLCVWGSEVAAAAHTTADNSRMMCSPPSWKSLGRGLDFAALSTCRVGVRRAISTMVRRAASCLHKQTAASWRTQSQGTTQLHKHDKEDTEGGVQGW
jgi:hypothetical protein